MTEEALEQKEKRLNERLARINSLEQEILLKQKKIKSKETAKKQILLRLSPALWDDIAQWAEADFRSINGQIEYILSEAVKKRKS